MRSCKTNASHLRNGNPVVSQRLDAGIKNDRLVTVPTKVRIEMCKQGFGAGNANLLVSSIVFFNLLAIIIFGASAAASPDISPSSLLYAGFNDGVVTQNPDYPFTPADAVFDPNGKVNQGLTVVSSLWTAHSFLSTSQPVIQSRRGSLAFWVKLTSLDRVESMISVMPGPAAVRINATPGSNNSGRLTIYIDFDGDGVDASKAIGSAGLGGVRDKVESDGFNFVPNEWHHFVWTWQGTHHKLYRDGTKVTTVVDDKDGTKVVGDKIAISAMPAVMNGRFNIGGGCCWAAPTLDELAVYNFPMNDAEALASYQNASSGPISANGVHGLDVVGQWAPGDGKVVVQADAGNEFALRAASYTVNVSRNGQAVASFGLANPVGGFAQGAYAFGTPLQPGSYVAQVNMLDSSGNLLGKPGTATFDVPTTSWLGNNLGIAPAGSVQAPWTPIVVAGQSLSVWGRTYDLTGGWGLPQRITSQGNQLLSSPVDLEFDIGSGSFKLGSGSVAITSIAPDRVTWTGSASGNGIQATVEGSLEYDGMVLLRLTLAPTGASINVQSIKLQTSMPASRAKYYSWASSTSGQVLSYDPGVPAAAGVFFSNRQQGVADKTALIPSIVLSDDNCGLEWFADSLQGWSVNQSMLDTTPFQQLSVDPNQIVRLENDFATQPFTLNAPVTITFGYEATPMRPLPVDWRAMQINAVANGTPAFPGVFALQSSYPDDPIRGQPHVFWDAYALTPGSYSTLESDTASVYQNEAAVALGGAYLTPYTQQHTLRGASSVPPHDTSSELGFLKFELANPDDFGSIGYVSMPTRGATDFWLHSMNYNLSYNNSNGIISAVYIDEPYYFANISAPVIGGSGYLDASLIARNGYNSLGVRTQLKRLRQLFIDHGKRPAIWIDASTGYVAPHMWAFADVISDGEGVFVLKPGDPDWIDRYNTPQGINWLKGISRTEKFGWVQAFLDEIRIYTDESYPAQYRAMIAMLSLFDISPTSNPWMSDWTNYLQARINFGMLGTQAAFYPYWSQSAITGGSSANVVCSYHAVGNSRLAHCANLGSSAYSGSINIDQAALGITGTLSAVDAETNASLNYVDGAVSLAIGRHDYRILKISGN